MSCTEMRCEDIFMCPVPSPGNCTNACTGYNNCSGGQICCPGVNGCLIGGCVTPRQPANGTCFGPNGTRYQVNQTFPLGDRCNYWYLIIDDVILVKRADHGIIILHARNNYRDTDS